MNFFTIAVEGFKEMSLVLFFFTCVGEEKKMFENVYYLHNWVIKRGEVRYFSVQILVILAPLNQKRFQLNVKFLRRYKCEIVIGRCRTHNDGQRLMALAHLSGTDDLKYTFECAAFISSL